MKSNHCTDKRFKIIGTISALLLLVLFLYLLYGHWAKTHGIRLSPSTDAHLPHTASSSMPLGTEIFNELSVPFLPTTFYYADIAYAEMLAYSLSPTGTQLHTMPLTPFSEGFLPTTHYTYYRGLLENYWDQQGEPYRLALQDVYETDSFALLSFSGTLADIYYIDRNKPIVLPLSFDSSEPLYQMYVSHVQQVGDTLYLLAGEANAYYGLLYTIDLPTLTVTHSLRLATHPSALNEQHYALALDGTAVFLYGDQLQVVSPTSATPTYYSLDFQGTHLAAIGTGITVVGTKSDGTYWYSTFHPTATTPSPLAAVPLSFPSPSCVPVTLLGDDTHLYTITFDAKGTLYKNYLSIYDRTTGKLLYCYGLYPRYPLALLRGQLN